MKPIKKVTAAIAVGVAGFGAGFVFASIFFVAVIIPEKFEFGRNTGFNNGLQMAAERLKLEFGVIDSKSPCKRLFSVKMTDVVSIEIDGVKTVRVIE